jgi:hypothetical protein
MNERIKELVKQSGGEFWQRLENDIVNPEAYITFDPPESLEKFAELIVRECAGICDNLEDEGVYHGVGEEHGTASIASAADCSFYIKTHFAVKE